SVVLQREIVVGQAGASDVWRRIKFEQLDGEWIEARGGNDVTAERLVAVLWICDDLAWQGLGEVAGTKGVREGGVVRLALVAQLEPFVVGHKEQPVFAVVELGNPDRPAYREAVLIPLKGRGNR